MDLTLDQLRVLDAVDRLGSFAAAGEELHRATSAISYGVRGLEDALRLEIFDRRGHRAVLTAAGRVVLEEGRRLLQGARRVEELAQQLRQQWEPRMSIVVDGALPQEPIMRALRRFAEAGLPTRAQLAVEYLHGVRERFARDHADLMIVLDFTGDAQHAATPMPVLEMVLVVHPDHPVRRARPVGRAALARHVELVVEDSRREGAPARGRLSLDSPQVFRFTDFHSKRQALLEGVGYGWMPRHLVREDLRRRRLVMLEHDEGQRFTFTPHLVHRRGTGLGRAAQLWVDLLREEQKRSRRG